MILLSDISLPSLTEMAGHFLLTPMSMCTDQSNCGIWKTFAHSARLSGKLHDQLSHLANSMSISTHISSFVHWQTRFHNSSHHAVLIWFDSCACQMAFGILENFAVRFENHHILVGGTMHMTEMPHLCSFPNRWHFQSNFLSLFLSSFGWLEHVILQLNNGNTNYIGFRVCILFHRIAFRKNKGSSLCTLVYTLINRSCSDISTNLQLEYQEIQRHYNIAVIGQQFFNPCMHFNMTLQLQLMICPTCSLSQACSCYLWIQVTHLHSLSYKPRRGWYQGSIFFALQHTWLWTIMQYIACYIWWAPPSHKCIKLLW